MTLYHFGNCIALVYLPYYFVYKYSNLSDYGAFWKCVQAGVIYAITQLFKMLVLATFFPDSGAIGISGFDVITEFLKSSIDLIDLVGLYIALYGIPGRGHIKILTAGLGWAGAEILLTRLLLLWVGARGSEFDWKYIQKSLESNISIISHISTAALVWMWSRYDAKQPSQPLTGLLITSSFKTFALEQAIRWLAIDIWQSILLKAFVTSILSLATLRLYVQFQESH